MHYRIHHPSHCGSFACSSLSFTTPPRRAQLPEARLWTGERERAIWAPLLSLLEESRMAFPEGNEADEGPPATRAESGACRLEANCCSRKGDACCRRNQSCGSM